MQVAARPGAQAIAGYLLKTGKSQADLCRDTGWRPAYLNRVLSGIVTFPGLEKITALRDGTGGELSADSFLPPLEKPKRQDER